jgi:hypothetical protein
MGKQMFTKMAFCFLCIELNCIIYHIWHSKAATTR